MDVGLPANLRAETHAQHRALEDQLKLPQRIVSRQELCTVVDPPFDTTARAAGGRYVLLGSAIGGRVLAPAIERRLGSGTAAATRFFRRDGLDPAQDWRTFQSAMTSRAWSRHETDQATGSARATFEFIAAVTRPFLISSDAGP